MTSGRSRHDHDAELARLLDAAEDGLVCFDERGLVLYANDSAAVLLGLDGDLTGSHLDALPASLHERVAHLLESGTRCPSRPFSILVGDRALSCRAWRSHSGPRSLAVSLHDDSLVVGRRDRVEAVLKATTDGLLVLSASDEVTYANPAALAMLHATEHELLGTRVSVDELLGLDPVPPPEGGPAHCRDIMNCEMPECPAYDSVDLRCWLMSGTLCDGAEEPKNFADKIARCRECVTRELLSENLDPLTEDEYRELSLERNGEQLVVKVKVTPITDSDGDYTGRVIAIRDITSEYEIAQMKNEFVSTVSHELRTPLTSIKGYVDLILDGDAGEINEIQKEFLGIVQENSDRLVELINDMLDISRIESGRIHLKVEPQYLPDLIEGAADTFRALASPGRPRDQAARARGPAARRRRHRPRAPSAAQPGQQRDQVLARGRRRDHQRQAHRRHRQGLGGRQGPGHQPRRPEDALHQVLPGRLGDDARDRRNGTGAVDLQEHHRAARRRDRRARARRAPARRSGSRCRWLPRR